MSKSKTVHYEKGERLKNDHARASLLNWTDAQENVDFTYHSATREFELLRSFSLKLSRRYVEDKTPEPTEA